MIWRHPEAAARLEPGKPAFHAWRDPGKQVSPNEDVEAAIYRLFVRMRQPRARDLCLVWDRHPAWQVPLPKTLFKGDTLHAFAGFDQAPGGRVKLQYQLDNGAVREEWAPVTAWPEQAEALARLVAARRPGGSRRRRKTGPSWTRRP